MTDDSSIPWGRPTSATPSWAGAGDPAFGAAATFGDDEVAPEAPEPTPEPADVGLAEPVWADDELDADGWPHGHLIEAEGTAEAPESPMDQLFPIDSALRLRDRVGTTTDRTPPTMASLGPSVAVGVITCAVVWALLHPGASQLPGHLVALLSGIGTGVLYHLCGWRTGALAAASCTTVVASSLLHPLLTVALGVVLALALVGRDVWEPVEDQQWTT